MKTVGKLFMLLSVVALMASCTPKPVKTIENLTAAFNGESTASAKYTAFAEKAKAEGFDTVAVMFLATSKAEAIHAANHKKVLEKLGVVVEGPQIGAFEVKTTAENLADAIKGETYEIDTMYPGFLTAAAEEKSADATKSFTWAVDTEKKHQAFYNRALTSVTAGVENTLPSNWFVCPVCGNTYDNTAVTAACDFCMTTPDKFISF